MPKARRLAAITAGAVVASMTGAWQVAVAQGDSTSNAAATPPAAAVAVSAPMVPRQVRGYELTDSVHLGDVSTGTQYTYTHAKKDIVHVFVSPYQRTDKLGLMADTVNYVTDDVTGYYQSLELEQRRGELEFFQVLHHGETDLHVRNHTIRAADVWARIRRCGAATWADTYFAVYALPTEMVRIRADLPPAIAANESVVPFSKSLVAALVTPP